MKSLQKKIVIISSKGDVNFVFSTSKNHNKNKFYINDNKNSLLLQKSYKLQSLKKFINYKKNIF